MADSTVVSGTEHCSASVEAQPFHTSRREINHLSQAASPFLMHSKHVDN
jgi:hypothetical protein